MHDQWYFSSEHLPDGFYLIEVVHSGKLLTFAPERSTLVQQEQHDEEDADSQVFELHHIGYRDYIIRHRLTGLLLTVHNGSPSPCAPIVLGRPQSNVTAYQTMNFERAEQQSSDWLIFLKHTRMVLDIDGGSQSSNARLVQYPQKRSSHNPSQQRFRLHPVVDRRPRNAPRSIPPEFIR